MSHSSVHLWWSDVASDGSDSRLLFGSAEHSLVVGRRCHVSDACILCARAGKAYHLRFAWNQFLLAERCPLAFPLEPVAAAVLALGGVCAGARPCSGPRSARALSECRGAQCWSSGLAEFR
eukprot:3651885-Alexandrium_andersonii.AAC.1